LGLNLFIASFRFEKPLLNLYRIVLPFTGILAIGLFMVMYVPPLSTVLVDADIREAYRKAEDRKEAPRDAWLMQCVQEDRSNPIPCTQADRDRYGPDGKKDPYASLEPAPTATPSGSASALPAGDHDDLLKQMMDTTGSGTPSDKPKDDHDDLLKQMMDSTSGGAPVPSTSASAKKPNLEKDDDLMKEMMK